MMLEVNKIYCMDCLEGMKEINSGVIDLIVTSPTYYYYRRSDYTEKNPRDILPSLSLIRYLEFIEDFSKEAFRVLNDCGFFVLNYGDCVVKTEKGYDEEVNISYIVKSVKKAGFKLLAKRIWVKRINPYNSLFIINFEDTSLGRFRTFTREWEYILFFYKTDCRLRRFDDYDLTYEEWRKWYNSIWKFDMKDLTKPPKSIHPIAFPLELPYRVIKMYSPFGGLVLDPFMGTGTTAVACKMLGRNFIGFEINPEYVKITEERLKRTPKNLRRVFG